MSEEHHLPEMLLSSIPWTENCHPIWPATSFFLHRNLARFPFAQTVSPDIASEMILKLKQAFMELSGVEKPYYLEGECLTKGEKEFLAEHFLSPEGWQNISKGQAFILDKSGRFLATLNVGDHLVLQSIDCKGNFESGWEALNNIETELSKTIDFAFSRRFGYLTADPKISGTGLIVSCYLHLPALIRAGKLPSLLSSQKAPNVEATGMLGNMEELLGDFVILKNAYTLGVGEESILRDLRVTATAFISAEKIERELCQKTGPADLKDLVSRAYGLLMHSYKLETKETLDAIGKIKLGIDLGWIKGMPDKEINELFFRCRKAHLEQIHQPDVVEKKGLAQTRAEYLHNQIRQTTLTL